MYKKLIEMKRYSLTLILSPTFEIVDTFHLDYIADWIKWLVKLLIDEPVINNIWVMSFIYHPLPLSVK